MGRREVRAVASGVHIRLPTRWPSACAYCANSRRYSTFLEKETRRVYRDRRFAAEGALIPMAPTPSILSDAPPRQGPVKFEMATAHALGLDVPRRRGDRKRLVCFDCSQSVMASATHKIVSGLPLSVKERSCIGHHRQDGYDPIPVLSPVKIPHCNTRSTRSRMAPRC
jgi:hypothetical protein